MTKVFNAAVPTTKKLKSMLKMLAEHGVVRYKDAEVEIELGGTPMVALAQPRKFDFGDYDQGAEPITESATQNVRLEHVDDLGNTEDDYLYWSAEG
jgi:hypothetical protein|tara:strand:+ start:1920 stop:2207 length:288 start_codon:yes stop_codon:yes gene_type:complete